jgi:hypothetical protein
LALVAAAAAQLPAGAAELNDYPTAARADYVFACMKTNGDTRQALEKCSCSIDVIASILPYDRCGDGLNAWAPRRLWALSCGSGQPKSRHRDGQWWAICE